MSKELVTIGNKNSLLTLGPDLGMHSHNKEIMRQKVCQGGHWGGNNPSDKMIKPRFQNILKSSEKQVKVLTVGHQPSLFSDLWGKWPWEWCLQPWPSEQPLWWRWTLWYVWAAIIVIASCYRKALTLGKTLTAHVSRKTWMCTVQMYNHNGSLQF